MPAHRATSAELRVARSSLGSLLELPKHLAGLGSGELLRWSIASADPESLLVEVTWSTVAARPGGDGVGGLDGHGTPVVISVVPTGIGCAIGGFAGDAAPATALLASCCDLLITNPNALNASDFISMRSNVLYVEGSMIDDFARGAIGLHRPVSNRIGIVIDRTDDHTLCQAQNVINAVRAVHGIDVVGINMTDRPIGARCKRMPSGAFTGELDEPETLLQACAVLLERGATALAIASVIEELPGDVYEQHFAGEAPNPVGGAEAVISHLVCRHFGVPVAHAPLVNILGGRPSLGVVDARGAAEAVSTTGLACVLIGLHRAPHPGPARHAPITEEVSASHLLAVVAPAGALGSPAVLAAVARRVPVLAVRENRSILDVSASALGLDGVYELDSYLSAAGAIVALREGIAPETIVRPLGGVSRFDAAPS